MKHEIQTRVKHLTAFAQTTGAGRGRASNHGHRSGFVAATPISMSTLFCYVMTAIVTAWFFVVSPAYANIEQLGPVYPIVEPNLLDEINQDVEAKKNSGELKRLEREAIARSRQSAVEPRAVAGIRRTTEARRYDWDPSVIYDNEVKDDKGRIMVHKGTKINPLEYVGLTKNFLFFDGRDQEQVAYARYLIAYYKGGVKPRHPTRSKS